jgi:hypothetical protein
LASPQALTVLISAPHAQKQQMSAGRQAGFEASTEQVFPASLLIWLAFFIKFLYIIETESVRS